MSHLSSILITCDIGDVIVVRGTLLDEAGDPVIDATVTARYIDPAGAETSLGAAAHEGAGVYAVNLEPDVSGRWEVRLDSADPDQAAAEGVVYVRESRFS